MVSPRRVTIVPHTHWDREWYEPFETFRLKLVDTLDALLDLLESDPSYSCFLMDGQMAAVDDYLEMRPEAEGRIRALALAGRLSLGPWYVLMDEFLVSGETIVRNLALGRERAALFGGAMEVGYLPDMFGHVAQMPQILAKAGMADAVVWRGVPSSITKGAFWWQSPDGSRVRTEYLVDGYANGATLPTTAAELVERTSAHERAFGGFFDGSLLLMNGSDHLPAQAHLGRLVSEANGAQTRYEFAVSSLGAYLAEGVDDSLECLEGELRSGARANMLMGVTSNRVDVKRAAARAEIGLERRAEPLWALFCSPEAFPKRLLDLAWRCVILNAAHDSICACSHDDVVSSVLERFGQASRLAEGLAQKALQALAASMARDGTYVVNTSSRARGGLVELLASGEGGHPAEQVLKSVAGGPGTLDLDAQSVSAILALIHSARIGDDAWIRGVKIDEDADRIHVLVEVGTDERKDLPLQALKENLAARLATRPDSQVTVTLDQPPLRRVLARVSAVPGHGWSPYEPTAPEHPVTTRQSAGPPHPSWALTNGLLEVAVDASEGTFSINGHGGLGRVVEGGDAGDSYNYSPPGKDCVVERPASVSVTLLEEGPLRAVAEMVALYHWPEAADSTVSSRIGDVEVTVTTRIEMVADEPFVKVRTGFVNRCRDHRVRLHFPLPHGAASSESGSAFCAVKRGLVAEGRPEERGLATFPARNFVVAGGLTLCHTGVYEHELIDLLGDGEDRKAGTLAMTLVRSTGMLSRVGMAYRPVPAGPLLPQEGLQMLGERIEATYLISTGELDPWRAAEDLAAPLETIVAPGGGWRDERGSALELGGAQVSSLRREEGCLEVRVFNPMDAPSVVSFGDVNGWEMDLRGTPLRSFDGSFELGPNAIATVRLSALNPR
ncbi:MAG: alpha-mannosidase [Acidimicrobiales bacterium]